MELLPLMIGAEDTVEDELTTEVPNALLLKSLLEMASVVEQWMLDDVEDAAKSWEQASCKGMIQQCRVKHFFIRIKMHLSS